MRGRRLDLGPGRPPRRLAAGIAAQVALHRLRETARLGLHFADALAGCGTWPADQAILAQARLHRLGLHRLEHRQAGDRRAVLQARNHAGERADVAFQAAHGLASRQRPPAAVRLRMHRQRPQLDGRHSTLEPVLWITPRAANRTIGIEPHHVSARRAGAQIEARNGAIEAGVPFLRQQLRKLEGSEPRREIERRGSLGSRRPHRCDVPCDDTITRPVLQHPTGKAGPARRRCRAEQRAQHRLHATGLEGDPGAALLAQTKIERFEITAQVVVDRDDQDVRILLRRQRDPRAAGGAA